jgi:hypothetical protein
MSFDVGVSSTGRALHVYLQNFFCALMNVAVVYPFAYLAFQRNLMSGIHPTR